MKKILLLFTFFISCTFARDWTALIYMVADNNLVQWADSDLVELQKIGSNDDIAIIVQVDKPNIGARRVFVHQGTVEELQNMGIIDMCNWSTLSDFLQWGINNYPAKKYCVILWDHGTGWTMMPQKTFGYDGSSGSRMSIANGDLRKALSTAYNYTGEIIDVIAFDACLMQQIEVAHELVDYARILVGPQTVCPLPGFRYDLIIDTLRACSGMNMSDLAQAMVTTTVGYYTDIQPVAYSAVRLSSLDDVRRSFQKFAQHLMVSIPTSNLYLIRDSVQTIPPSGTTPSPLNGYIDLGDWLARINMVMPGTEVQELLNVYGSSIVFYQSWGSDFVNTTGLTIWYPYTYREFKQLIDIYQMLTWFSSSWASFLNWIYDSDDIRPTQVSLSASDIGRSNDFRLSWTKSHDLAEITYTLIESQDTNTIWYEPCEDTLQWDVNGFSLSSNNVHTGAFAFYSGNISNAQHFMITKDYIVLDDYGILSLYLYYNTEDIVDSLSILYGFDKDVHYGRSNGWQERRILLPPGNSKVSLSYITNASINNGGCYIDDIRLYQLNNARFVRQAMSDTSLYLFNKEQGNYLYYARPDDRYFNFGNLSAAIHVTIQEYAEPYTNPNPFQDDCFIMLDYPDSLYPQVEVFSITGRFIQRFMHSDINNKAIYWDGKDLSGREVGSGLYFILIKDGAFKKIGKIARQR